MAEFPVKWMSSDMQGAPVLQYGEIGSLKALLEAVLVTGFGTTTIDTLTYDSEEGEGIIEITAGHSFKQHQIIEIAGADQAEYNGQWRVSSVTSTLIRFAMDVVPSANGSGTMTVKTPSPGWTMPFESADGNRAVFKPDNAQVDGGSGMYWYIDNTDSAVASWAPSTSSAYHYAKIAGFEDVVDIDTRIGEMHGKDALYAMRYVSGHIRHWVVVADSRTIYLAIRDEDSLNSSYAMAPMLAWGDVVSSRRPDFRDAFLSMQYAPSTGNTFINYFGYSVNTPSGRIVSEGAVPQDKVAGLRYIGVAENQSAEQADYPGYTGKILARPIMAGALSNNSSSPIACGLLPGILESLSGPCLVHKHVIEQDGKLYIALRYDPSVKGSPSVSMNIIDITGPWY